MRSSVLAFTALLACSRPAKQAEAPLARPPEPAIFELEARREAATPFLIARTRGDDALRAIRALGRVGDTPAVTHLLELLADPNSERREAAARALGFAALLGSDVRDAEARLLTWWPRASLAERTTIAEVLGQLGGAASLPALAGVLRDDHEPLRAIAGFAIGRLGRRKVGFDEPTRTTLTDTPGLAALYAVASEPGPPDDTHARARLHAHASHPDPALRRLAVMGLLARSPAQSPLGDCIVRALHTESSDAALAFQPDISDAQALTLLREWAAVYFGLPRPQHGSPGYRRPRTPLIHDDGWPERARQLLAGLGCVAAAKPGQVDPERRAELVALRSAVQAADALAAADRGASPAALALRKTLAQLDCRLAQLLARDPAWQLPLVCRAQQETTAQSLEPAVLVEGFGGTWPQRQLRLDQLLRTGDPGVRIATITAIANLWDDPGAATFVQAWLLAALADRKLGVVGAVAEAITARCKRDPAPRFTNDDPLWRALGQKTGEALGREPELYTTLVATLAATKVPAGARSCDAGLRHANPSVRAAARTCIKELRGTDPGPQLSAGAPTPPPVDPARLRGHRVRWLLTTEYGELRIDLDPDAAPWAVAAIVTLTERGFYDGLGFHRDVPGFVLQGGDPEGTGSGGPGFSLPSEPSAHRFEHGAVGIADAGKDTGGSQFFIMHGRAPHLDGRYTWIGKLHPRSYALLPLLTVGDRILKARVVLQPSFSADP